MIVVSDTTPIISLAKIKRLDILESLYGEVLIPEAVQQELIRNTKFDDEIYELNKCDFIKTVKADPEEAKRVMMYGNVHQGEGEAIAYTYQNNADLLLLDDKRARYIARNMRLPVAGTIGILIKAYDLNILSADEILECDRMLKSSSLFITNSLHDYLLEHVSLSEVERIKDDPDRLDKMLNRIKENSADKVEAETCSLYYWTDENGKGENEL